MDIRKPLYDYMESKRVIFVAQLDMGGFFSPNKLVAKLLWSFSQLLTTCTKNWKSANPHLSNTPENKQLNWLRKSSQVGPKS